MTTLIRWLGVLVICTWVATFLTALTMMWHPAWMAADNPPISKILVEGLHFSAVATGACLGPMLLFKPLRQHLNMLHKTSYVLGFLLALITLSRLL